ncbi:Ig-like domain-containing protein [Fodinicola acaciae]|uniref:Ig-like domain-containing protein n=1 Tax=Fodinicola acaciae TaxID=2681555 RepID=UPI001FE904BB|nr:Ig-like domain-containing protein [Fodinicola acaciae]
MLPHLSGDLDRTAFATEADPWLRKAEAYGAGGAAIVRSLTAERAGALTEAWLQRAIFDAEHPDTWPQTVAPGVLDPFCERARSASGLVRLSAPDPSTPLTPGSDVTLAATVRSGAVPIRSVRFLVGDTVIGTATSAPYQVVWHDLPRRVARTVVEVTDATGAVVRSSPATLTIGKPDRVLLVYGNDGNPGTGGLAAGEVAVRDRLELLGLAVDAVPAKQVSTADATGEALVMVSSTVAGDVAAKFRDVAVPFVGWEAYIFDDMGMSSSQGEEFRVRTVHFVPSALSAGLSGDVDVGTTHVRVGLWNAAEFAERCRRAGLASVLEAVVRPVRTKTGIARRPCWRPPRS